MHLVDIESAIVAIFILPLTLKSNVFVPDKFLMKYLSPIAELINGVATCWNGCELRVNVNGLPLLSKFGFGNPCIGKGKQVGKVQSFGTSKTGTPEPSLGWSSPVNSAMVINGVPPSIFAYFTFALSVKLNSYGLSALLLNLVKNPPSLTLHSQSSS